MGQSFSVAAPRFTSLGDADLTGEWWDDKVAKVAWDRPELVRSTRPLGATTRRERPMSQIQIPDRLAERLNALMRPADGVSNYAISAGILAAVTDAGGEDARIAALAYVFANQPFARWSGPPTSATEYPAAPDFDGRDRAAFEALQQDRQFPKQLIALGTQVSADEVDVPERARRAWAFLAKHCPTPMAKVTALATMLQDPSPFLGGSTPSTDVRHNEALPDEEYRGILWRHRAVIARLNGIRMSDVLATKTATGAAVLAAISEIRDERERAVILGYFLGSQRSGIDVRALAIELPSADDLLGALGEAARRVREAAEKGEPCPICHKVHTKGEGHEDE